MAWAVQECKNCGELDAEESATGINDEESNAGLGVVPTAPPSFARLDGS